MSKLKNSKIYLRRTNFRAVRIWPRAWTYCNVFYPYNVRHQQVPDSRDPYIFNASEMKASFEFAKSIIKHGEQGHSFCSAVQFARW